MEFGRIDKETLDTIDFSLTADHPRTQTLLASAQQKDHTPGLFVGCAKWGRKDWIGTLYPEGTKEADFLRLYGENFNSLELNATFYKLPSQKQTAAWAASVGDGFLFCPKISNSISHIRRLKDVEDRTRYYFESLTGFGDKLGGVLLMLHPQMGPKALDRLETFFKLVPENVRLFIELRHEAWYEPEAFDAVFDLLEHHRVGAVITDVAGRRDCAHMRLTTDEAFIRFVGNDLHESDYRRVDDWVARVGQWMHAGIRRVYFFLHQDTEKYTPVIARYAIERFNEKLGTMLKVPGIGNREL